MTSMLPKDYYRKVEQPGFLQNVLYGDTDSIFILVPADTSSMDLNQKWELAEKSADDINNLMLEYLTKQLLPRCNINPERNETFFKTELLFGAILFLDVKKQYAFVLLVKEGKIIDPPKVKYTGIQVVKSDASKFTQQLLKRMVEGIALNTDIPKNQKRDRLIDVVNEYHQKFHKDADDYNFEFIGLPGKWGGRAMFVNGMKLFNTIMGKEVFDVGSAGRFVYCKIYDPALFPKLEMKDTKGLCVPYSYDLEELKKKMIEFKIEIDRNVQWDKLYTTTCQRVVKLIKESFK